jgi:hypothetical protein
VLKKPTLDPSNTSSYRPISKFSFTSTVVETAVDTRLTEHVSRHQLLPVRPPVGHWPCHSTETAIVAVYNDMIDILDMGHVGTLVLLNMSSAFDTVDHANLV